MKLNKEWHLANPMPRNATLDQRIAWHQEHVRNCNCRPMPRELERVIKKYSKRGNKR